MPVPSHHRILLPCSLEPRLIVKKIAKCLGLRPVDGLKNEAGVFSGNELCIAEVLTIRFHILRWTYLFLLLPIAEILMDSLCGHVPPPANASTRSTEIHYLEVSSLNGPSSAVAQPFLFIARSVLLLIESGTLDPEREPGCGISYGDRGGYYGLRRVRSGTGSARSGSGDSARLSVLLGTSGAIGARRRWSTFAGRRGGRCC